MIKFIDLLRESFEEDEDYKITPETIKKIKLTKT
jgi:hypothetical protein